MNNKNHMTILFVVLILILPVLLEANWCVGTGSKLPNGPNPTSNNPDDQKPPGSASGCPGPACKPENPECKLCTTSPFFAGSGIYSFSVLDLEIPTRGFPLTVKRNYDSSGLVDGLFGYGWTSNLTPRITRSIYMFAAPSTYKIEAAMLMPFGKIYRYTENANGTNYTPPLGGKDSLVRNGDGSYDYTPELSRSRYHYDSNGQLAWMRDEFNNTLNYSYCPDSIGIGLFLKWS